MVLQRIRSRYITWICLAGVIAPRTAVCRAESLTSVQVRDAELAPGGVFRGAVRDVNGRGLPAQDVVLHHPTLGPVSVKTDAAGEFAFAGLSGGTCVVQVAGQPHPVRLWMPGTAPPGAASAALFVPGDPLVRGQHPIGSLVTCEPLMIGVLLAAAIAIPIALHDSGDGPPGS